MADLEAVRVFADNMKDLMLAPALGEKRVLAIDPGNGLALARKQEALMQDYKIYAALAYARENKLNHTTIDSPNAKLGIIVSSVRALQHWLLSVPWKKTHIGPTLLPNESTWFATRTWKHIDALSV